MGFFSLQPSKPHFTIRFFITLGAMRNKGVVCHTMALPFTFLKKHCKEREEL
jgi:hypothetical protein